MSFAASEKTKPRSSLSPWALSLCLFAGACSSSLPPAPRYLPARDLLEIVKDFHRHSREDLYRFPIPKDVTGTNIMKATLLRLNDYEQKNPGQFSDLIHFNKAIAYERLREYDQALVYYRKVAETNGRLGAEAKKNMEALERFQKARSIPLPSDTPLEYMRALDEKVRAWNDLIREYEGTPYEYLARIEEEKTDRAKVAFVRLNRHRLKDGNHLVLLGYTQLVTKHRQSKNLHRYLLDFGDFYLLLADEYVAQYDPEGLAFDLERFEQLAMSALKLYTEVAEVDGIVEKIEAQGKIEALRGFMEKARRLSR